MAKHNQPAKSRMHFTDMDAVPATYTDTFILVSERETSISHLYFFQSQLGLTNMEVGTAQVGANTKAKCVAHLVLSEKAIEALFKGLADNRGVKLNTKAEDHK